MLSLDNSGKRVGAQRPGWMVLIVVLMLLPVLASMGFWQLQRAEEKRSLQAEYDRRANAGLITVSGRVQSLEELKYYRVRLKGQYEYDRQILLDNRIHKARAGYHVLTPFRIRNSDTRILVNRGWIPLGNSRDTLPEARPPAGTITLTGLATAPLKGGVHLGPAYPDDGKWHRRWQFVDLDHFASVSPYPVQPVMVLLDPGEQPGGLLREWRRLDAGIAVHQGYAFQWFSLAVTLIGIYLFFLFRKPGRAEGTDTDIEA
ncbi:MAG: SURF1 family protein [Proteobacteria bacterium]|nr:SURF1 family protein [Pseudomonadota bacterium]